jgi:hypothetical protein
MNWKQINQQYIVPAISAWRQGRNEEAEAIFQQGLLDSGKDGFVCLKYAEFLSDSGRFSEAKEYFEISANKLPLPQYKKLAVEGLENVNQLISVKKPESEMVSQQQVKSKGLKIGLISCTREKKPFPCSARSLYSESVEFRACLEFAETHYDSVFIVSVKHGLVRLDELLNPYDLSLEELSEGARNLWAEEIAKSIGAEGITVYDTIYIHACALYIEHLYQVLEKRGLKVRAFDVNKLPLPQELD